MGLDADTALWPLDGAGAFEGRIVDGWAAPRGPLGGYVLAIVVRGLMEAVGDPERQPRSVTMHFLRRPEAAPVQVLTKVERVGGSMTTVSARLEQDGRLMGLALGAFSKPRPGPVFDDQAPMPAVEAPDPARPPAPDLPGDRGHPPFAERVTLQRSFGAEFFSGADSAELGGWMGLREHRPVDALTVAVLADAWYPASWARLTSLAPAPTVDLTLPFRAPLPLPDSLLVGRFRTRLVRDGFFEEDGELWAPDGTLVAHSRQLAILVGAEG